MTSQVFVRSLARLMCLNFQRFLYVCLNPKIHHSAMLRMIQSFFFLSWKYLSFCLLECQYWNLTVVIFVRDSAYKIAHDHLEKKKEEIFD